VCGPFVAAFPVHVLLVAESAREETQELSAAAFGPCAFGRHNADFCKRCACSPEGGGVTCVFFGAVAKW
jgi:hypothetical protein